jgi:phosphoribosylformylglycinamidine (FGAM) synthase PurS component
MSQETAEWTVMVYLAVAHMLGKAQWHSVADCHIIALMEIKLDKPDSFSAKENLACMDC